ncbi:MAG: hypothetical protein AB7T06_40080 [Kofleriaceae bacterium]
MTAADDERQLARAVEKLCRPYVVSHVQRMPGGGRRTVSTTHSPLIVMLRTAGTPSQGAAGASASERVPVDDGALRMLRELTADIADLWRELLPGAVQNGGLLRNFPVPERALDTWHQLFTRYLHADFTPPPYALGTDTRSFITEGELQIAAGVCSRWVEAIELRFDPPPSIEGTIICPECRQRWGRSTIGDRVAAITITYGGSVATSSAVCRACGSTWLGRQQLEDLAAGRSRRRGGGHVAPSSGDTEPADRADRHADRNI